MLIIVEGVDGVGKTLFVEQLREVIEGLPWMTQVEVLHAGPPKSVEILEEYELPLQHYRPGDGQTVICDRWHLGELIYGPLLRGQCLLPPHKRYHLEKFLEAKGVYIVHLMAPLSEILRRRAGRDEPDLLTDDQVEFVSDRYFEETFDSLVRTGEIYIHEKHSDRAINYVIRQAHITESQAAKFVEFPTYIGPHDPEVLLLGETRNQNRDTRWDSAFVPLNASSGAFLFSHLTEDVRMTCGVANAAEVDIGALTTVLDNPSVVALGAVADKLCKEAEIDHGAVPHPQYVRRFHNAHGKRYGAVIRRAAKFQEDLLSWRP